MKANQPLSFSLDARQIFEGHLKALFRSAVDLWQKEFFFEAGGELRINCMSKGHFV